MDLAKSKNVTCLFNEPAVNDGLPHGFMYLRLADLRGFEELMIDFAEEPPELQMLIDKANARGLDTAAVQAALDALTASLPAAVTAHESGEAILASHAGFDEKGNIEDLETAIRTVRALGEVLRNTREAMDDTGTALRDAIRDFREANFPPRT